MSDTPIDLDALEAWANDQCYAGCRHCARKRQVAALVAELRGARAEWDEERRFRGGAENHRDAAIESLEAAEAELAVLRERFDAAKAHAAEASDYADTFAAKLAVLRPAIAFYAERHNYVATPGGSPIWHDAGKRARAALGDFPDPPLVVLDLTEWDEQTVTYEWPKRRIDPDTRVFKRRATSMEDAP